MRWLFVVRFHENGNHNGTKSFKTVANSPKAAAKKMHKKGQIISVRKVKKLAP